MWLDELMVIEFGEVIIIFVAILKKKTNSATKQHNITHINRRRITSNCKIGLPLNSLFLYL